MGWVLALRSESRRSLAYEQGDECELELSTLNNAARYVRFRQQELGEVYDSLQF